MLICRCLSQLCPLNTAIALKPSKKGRSMKTLRIGARRLYDSMGCSLYNQQPFSLVFPFGDHLQMEIYMGNKPKFGITVETEHDKYIIPGALSRLGSYIYHADATQSPYPRNFFT